MMLLFFVYFVIASTRFFGGFSFYSTTTSTYDNVVFFLFSLVESFVFVLPIKIVARLYVFSLQCLYEMKIFSKALNKL